MPDDGYLSSAWESSAPNDHRTSSSSRPPLRSGELQDSEGRITSSTHARSSSESHVESFTLKDSSVSNGLPDKSLLSDTAAGDAIFDEGIIRSLCELDCGVPLLLDRIKQSMVSCREASVFFKKRAVIEEEYGKSMQKLSRATSEVYSMNDGKAGSFVSAWQISMKIHETLGENRIRFAQRLNEMSEELATLAKEVDKNRKSTKELATRYERALQESEGVTEKCRTRLDITSEELERVLLQKEGESLKDNTVQTRPSGAAGKRAIGKAVAKGGLLLKGKNPQNIQRQEDDIRTRVSNASDAFRKAVTDTQAMRQEYFNFQLPRILRALKECADEIDLGTQYHLTRYAFLFEGSVLTDGSTLVPPKGDEHRSAGLKNAIEMIDNRGDFKTYMQNYAYAHGNSTPRGPRREGPADEGFLPPIPSHIDKLQPAVNGYGTNPAPGHLTFGVDLGEQMSRDDVEVPPIMKKCCEAIEKYGINFQGIYRVGGTITKINTLQSLLDKDVDAVDLDSKEWTSDINNVTSVLKKWLRELPDPLMTNIIQQGFMDAACIENERLRHIRLHERVNDLPDPNYATLKYFLGHLHRISLNSEKNLMTKTNIAIVLGPSVFGPHLDLTKDPEWVAKVQKQALETILLHYTDIFEEDTEL